MCVYVCVYMSYIYIEREVGNGCEMGVKCRFMCQQSWVVEGGMS